MTTETESICKANNCFPLVEELILVLSNQLMEERTMAESKPKLDQIADPNSKVFADGFKLRTKFSLWLDGKDKKKSLDSYKDEYGEKEGLAKWREEVDSLHVINVEFDFTGVVIGDYVKKTVTASNSPIVWYQNQIRPKYRDQFDSEEEFAEWLSSHNEPFVIKISDYVESQRAKGSGADFGKAKKFVEQTNDAEALKKLVAEAEAKLAALNGK